MARARRAGLPGRATGKQLFGYPGVYTCICTWVCSGWVDSMVGGIDWCM